MYQQGADIFDPVIHMQILIGTFVWVLICLALAWLAKKMIH